MTDLKRRCLPAEPRRSTEKGSRFGYVGLQFGVGVGAAPAAKNGGDPNSGEVVKPEEKTQ